MMSTYLSSISQPRIFDTFADRMLASVPMKLGCFGCLFLIVALLVIVVVILGGIFLSTNIFRPPEVRPVAFTRHDGYSAQQKLFEGVSRQSGRSSRHDPITL